jgi:hypothetical protein
MKERQHGVAALGENPLVNNVSKLLPDGWSRSVLAEAPPAKDFFSDRQKILRSVEAAAAAWNEAVATLITKVGQVTTSFATRSRGPGWHERAAQALRAMREPLHSDVILATRTPMLKNDAIRASVRVFCSTVLEQNLEFMPRTMDYPKFPYFTVEPATQESLFKEGLYLLANPSGMDEEEPNIPGVSISRETYLRTPMISVELDLASIGSGNDGAVLLNWSFRGRAGAHAKIFINGELDVPAFEVRSSDDDETPNFWTVVPWATGEVVIDLKHVGSGYLWFEHVDVHHVTWPI